MLPEGFSPPSPAPGIGYGVKTWQSEVFDILPSGLVVLDADGVIVYANSAAARFLGASRDQLPGRIAIDQCRHIVHEDGSDFPGDQHPTAVALRTAAPVLGSVMGVAVPVLGLRWLRMDAVPTLDQADRPAQVVVSMTDVTARHVAAEQAGRVYAALAGRVLMLDGEGRITEANATAETLLGVSKADLRGHMLVNSPWRCVTWLCCATNLSPRSVTNCAVPSPRSWAMVSCFRRIGTV